MNTFSNSSLVLASFLGFAFFIVGSWQEWQKLSGAKQSLKQFIIDDQPGFASAVLLTVASYIALPEIGQIAWARDTLGFAPTKTPLGAMAASFGFSVLGYQLRALFLRKVGK